MHPKGGGAQLTRQREVEKTGGGSRLWMQSTQPLRPAISAD